MLSDYEAAEIERRFREGEKGPVVTTWVGKLLADRRARLEQQRYFRERVKAAFVYLDRLLEGLEPKPLSGRICPKCRREYEVAKPHLSSRGQVYVHADRMECVVPANS